MPSLDGSYITEPIRKTEINNKQTEMKDKEKIKKRVIRIIVAVIIPECAAFVF